MLEPATIADLPSFLCGHAEDFDAATGCTVVIAPNGATCGVAVYGGGPATRETDLLKPENPTERIHAIVLAGGSAFGLAASTGVMNELAHRGIGFFVEEACVPLVTGACIFDLLIGKNTYPDATMGRTATQAAFAYQENQTHLRDTATQENNGKEETMCAGCLPQQKSTATDGNAKPPIENTSSFLAEGNVGVGCGATVGKLLGGKNAMKAGFGMYGLRCGELVVCALVVANAVGNICNKEGTWIAGSRDEHNNLVDPLEAFSMLTSLQKTSSETSNTPPQHNNTHSQNNICSNTTLGIILTNAKLSKAQATKVSCATHDAYARTIKPVHTSMDGDTVFTFASGDIETTLDMVSVIATEAMEHALIRSVQQATDAYGLPSVQSLKEKHPTL